LLAVLLAFVGWNYLHGIQFFPHSHGDEASLLDIPYRWTHYGDLRFPVYWSRSFGADEMRFTPPVAAFTLRNLYHAVVGFAPALSRVFSAGLFFSMMLTVPFYLRRAGLGPWARLLILCQLALAPTILLGARSMRTEQEVLVAGWFGAVMLPCLVPALKARWARATCWIAAGLLMALPGGSHPLGAAYAVAGLWLLANARRWRAWDGLRLWQRVAWLGIGAALVAAPTIRQLTNPATRGYVAHVTELYKVRDRQLTPYLAAQPPWGWLRESLPDGFVARLNVVHAASYADFFDYPVPNFRYRPLLIGWYYGELLLVLGYFLYSLSCGFRNANPWVHLAVLLAVAFLSVNLWFFPVFSYAIYSTFYVTLAAGVVLTRLVAPRPVPSPLPQQTVQGMPVFRGAPAALYLAASLLFLYYGASHIGHVASAVSSGSIPHVSLDQEFDALEGMSRRLDLKRDDKIVYTSTESWMAAGKNNESLWESIMLGLVEPSPAAAGAVFKNAHMEFFLGVYGADIPSTFPSRQERLKRLDTFLSRLHLRGLILSDWEREGAYSLYTAMPAEPGRLLVARMHRTRETDFQKAVLQEEIDHPKTIALSPGRYVLCVWTTVDARDGLLEVHPEAGEECASRVNLGSLTAVVPAPIFVEVVGSRRTFQLDCRAQQRIIPIRKLQVYRLKTTYALSPPPDEERASALRAVREVRRGFARGSTGAPAADWLSPGGRRAATGHRGP
jgi:hypothetical protein